MSSLIKYTFPDLGSISIPLYAESKEVYELLTKEGEIERLKRLDHLGHVRNIHSSAHYSRWEYVVRQLHTVELLRNSAKTYGLSAKLKLNTHTISSASEAIKSWILLSNYGHLEGIFDNERIWFLLMREYPSVFNKFRQGFKSKVEKINLRNLELNGDYYSLNRFIALYLFNTKPNKKTLDYLCLDILRTFIFPHKPGGKVAFCKSIYERVRLISFIQLDLNNSPQGILINTLILLQKFESNPQELVFSSGTPFDIQWDAIQELLFKNIYASKEMVAWRVGHWKEQRNKYKNLINGQSIKYFSKNLRTLHSRLLYAKKHEFCKTRGLHNINHILRMELLSNPTIEGQTIFTRPPINCFKDEEYIKDIAHPSPLEFVITPTFYLGKYCGVVDVFSEQKINPEEKTVGFWTLLRYLDRYRSEFPKFTFIRDLISRKPITQLFEGLLAHFLIPNYQIRLSMNSVPKGEFVHYFTTVQELRNWRKSIKKDKKWRDFDRDRIWEIVCLRNLLGREKRGRILVGAGRIVIYDTKGDSMAEFDGIYFFISKRFIRGTFLEAKRGVSRRADIAKKDLQEGIEKSMGQGINYKITKRKGLAYADIDFNEIVKSR